MSCAPQYFAQIVRAAAFGCNATLPSVMQTAVIISSEACEVDAASSNAVHRAEREIEIEKEKRESTVICLTDDWEQDALATRQCPGYLFAARQKQLLEMLRCRAVSCDSGLELRILISILLRYVWQHKGAR